MSLSLWTKTSNPVKHQHISSQHRVADFLVHPPKVASAVELPAAEEHTELPAAEKHTYGQILESYVLIGGSSVLNIGIGIVRTVIRCRRPSRPPRQSVGNRHDNIRNRTNIRITSTLNFLIAFACTFVI
jgi:hypothetical protein